MVIAPVFLLLASEGCRAAPMLPTIVAHRGASEDAPENTLASFRLGFDQGADRVEGDFRMTSDGHIVAMHDGNLSRTTGMNREVFEISLDEIRNLSAGDWGPWQGGAFQGEGVPTLAEVFAIVPEDGGILLEIKESDRIVPVLIREMERSGIGPDRIAVIAFDRKLVETLKRTAPKWKALWLASFSRKEGKWRPTVEEIIDVATTIGANGVGIQAEPDVVDRDFVKRVKAAGLEIHVWTVNDPDLAVEMRSIGIDSITTDRPRLILDALEG